MYFCIVSVAVGCLFYGRGCLDGRWDGVDLKYNPFLFKLPGFPTRFGTREVTSDGILYSLKRSLIPMIRSRIDEKLALFVAC